MSRNGILAGGNWIVDHVKLINTWPPQDALASILTQSDGNGGSAYNLLKNLARLGAQFPLEAVGLVGDDSDGRAIFADCAAHRSATLRAARFSTSAAPTPCSPPRTLILPPPTRRFFTSAISCCSTPSIPRAWTDVPPPPPCSPAPAPPVSSPPSIA